MSATSVASGGSGGSAGSTASMIKDTLLGQATLEPAAGMKEALVR